MLGLRGIFEIRVQHLKAKSYPRSAKQDPECPLQSHEVAALLRFSFHCSGSAS